MPEKSTKQIYWIEHIKRWSESDLSGAQYCKKHQLTYHCFVYWRGKLDNNNHGLITSSPSGFSKVEVRGAVCHSSEGLSLHFPGGLYVQGISDENLPLLRQLCQALS